jgi:peptidoglycan/LPS O-acetylase OafA/YrhL
LSTGATVATDGRRVTGLDGIRAFAVTAVILYHASTWANGGYFGVDVFFVLSGYLITTLLLSEWRDTGGIGLRSFWARRARRLLPALFVMLAVVGAVAIALPQVLGSPGLLGDTVASVFYVANWHLLAAHTNYFDLVANQSPLLHTWSLAIEEQFYLVWPLVVLALVGALRHRGRVSPGPDGVRRRLALVAVVAAVGAVASAVLMAVITPVGTLSVSRSYYGSDTRAQSILIGAALAAACLWWGPVRTAWGRRALWLAGMVGAVGVIVMWRTVPETSALTFHGGFFLVSVATAGVIACVTLTSGHPVSWLLCLRPLPYIGRISYGMYLWYLPVLLVMTAGRTHLGGVALLAARLSVIVGIAAASFHLVETPIRRGALRGWKTWAAIPVAAATVSLLPVFVPTLGELVPTADAAVTHTPSILAGSTSPEPSAHPVRILLVGDSMAGSLGVGLSTVADQYDAEVVNEGSPGCSLAEGAQAKVLWYTVAPGAPCSSSDPQHLLDVYRSEVTKFDPDVVVYLARSDTFDTDLDGSWQHVGDPSFDRWALTRYEGAIAVLGSGGAHVVLLTSPYYDSGEQGDGQPWPENDPTRVVDVNRLLLRAARTDPRTATVIDTGALLDPSHQFATQVDGVPVRCTDGVHFTVPGGQWVGEHLLPRLVSLGRSHAYAAALLHRAPLVPQPPPAWYAGLPCSN